MESADRRSSVPSQMQDTTYVSLSCFRCQNRVPVKVNYTCTRDMDQLRRGDTVFLQMSQAAFSKRLYPMHQRCQLLHVTALITSSDMPDKIPQCGMGSA